MVLALAKITQGAHTDVAGRAVIVDKTSGPVTITNGNDTGVALWTFELLDVPPDSALTPSTQGPSAVSSFEFAEPDVPGSYRVRVTVFDSSGSSDVDIRNAVVPLPNKSVVQPPYQADPPPLPLEGAGAKPDELNVGGQRRGWAGDNDPSRVLLHQLLALLDAGNLGGFTAGGDLSGTGSNQNVIKVHGATVPVAGTLTPGNLLLVSGTSALIYAALNLAGGSASVTGALPAGNQAPQTMGGDNSGTTAASVVTQLQGRALASTAPNKLQSIASLNGSSWAPVSGVLPVAKASITLTGASQDVTAFTVPASPAGSGTFVITQVLTRLSTGMTGSGSVVVTVGSTVGGNDIMTAQTVNNATAVGIFGGLSIASLGTGMAAGNGYEMAEGAAGVISMRCAGSGTVSGGVVDVYVYGFFLP